VVGFLTTIALYAYVYIFTYSHTYQKVYGIIGFDGGY